MDALQELLKRKWILRKEEPDLYNMVRDSVKRFVNLYKKNLAI